MVRAIKSRVYGTLDVRLQLFMAQNNLPNEKMSKKANENLETNIS